MAFSLFEDLVWVLVGATLSVLLSKKLRAPSIIGFILSGVIVGPSVLGLVSNVHEIELIAEIGVVLLLFTIGVEFSVGQLSKIRKVVLLGGGIQTLLTVLVVTSSLASFGFSVVESFVLALLVSLGSTAVVLKLLQDRGELQSLHGRTALGILLFQDVMIVPMMLVLPLLSEQTASGPADIALMLLKGVGIVIALLFLASRLVPFILLQVAKTKSADLFLIAVVGICFTVALVTSKAGLSLALGALLAGLIISESQFSHQVLDKISPFQRLFTSIFFVSVGMLLDISVALENWGIVLGGAIAVIVIKFLLCLPAGFALGFPLRTVAFSSVILAQVGEFSFILSKSAKDLAVITPHTYQVFLAISVITIIATPLLFWLAPLVVRRLELLPLPARVRLGKNLSASPAPDASLELTGHVVIVGYGFTGRSIAEETKTLGLPYCVIETNPETVAREKARGVPIVYGDASIPALLESISIKKARVAIIAVSDTFATRKITGTIRALNPSLHIIVRTRFVTEIESLYGEGADEVIPLEFETTLEILGRTLDHLGISPEIITGTLARSRAEHYRSCRDRFTSEGEIGTT